MSTLEGISTSAALAAALLASLPSPPDEPPNFWPWLLIFGTEARGFDCRGGAEPTGRPGWEKGSFSLEGLPQRLPIVSRSKGPLVSRCVYWPKDHTLSWSFWWVLAFRRVKSHELRFRSVVNVHKCETI